MADAMYFKEPMIYAPDKDCADCNGGGLKRIKVDTDDPRALHKPTKSPSIGTVEVNAWELCGCTRRRPV